MGETFNAWSEFRLAEETGWNLIASIDESEPYEVDQTAIFADGDEWILATASGCSCWDGDWEVERYDSLDSLFESIGPKSGVGRAYNPSFAGAEALRAQVEARLNA